MSKQILSKATIEFPFALVKLIKEYFPNYSDTEAIDLSAWMVIGSITYTHLKRSPFEDEKGNLCI